MRFLHLECQIVRPPRRPGLRPRHSTRPVTLAYSVDGACVTAGIAFTHKGDTFIKKTGAAKALENYHTVPFDFYMGRADLPTVEWTDEIIDVLCAHGREVIPNLPYTRPEGNEFVFDIDLIFFSRRVK